MESASPHPFGRFWVHEALGSDALSSLHRAELPMGQGPPMPIALRRLLPHLAADEHAVRALAQQAQLASFLRHPGVTQVYEIGNVDGAMFIAEELVLGRSLAELPRQPMPPAIALAVIAQLCDTLAYVHTAVDPAGTPLGLFHGELAPEHVVVLATGQVKLVGFGRMMQPPLGYTAPELVAWGVRDWRSDLFAVGVLAYELLAGRPLFTGANDQQTLERLNGLVIPPPSSIDPRIPAEIDSVIMTALSRDPAYRWQHTLQMRDGFQAVAHQYGLVMPPEQIGAWLAESAAPAPPAASRSPAPVPVPVPALGLEDDDDQATQFQEVNPQILELAEKEIAKLAEARTSASAIRAPLPPPEPAMPPDPAMPPEPAPPPAQAMFMGPEPTQIGAQPILFGDIPMTAQLAGAPKPAMKKLVLPEPSGVSLPDEAEPSTRGLGFYMLVALLALGIVIAIVVLVTR